jgi:tetratricopeptide (TPR) repeat protein
MPAFTGRTTELASLDALAGLDVIVPPGAGAGPATVAVCAVSGTAGVGKTALVVHWAHLVAKWFPDGQLYVNLRGFDPADYFEAIACYERAIALSRDLADRFNEADTLSRLGDVHHSAGDIGAARRAWGDALRIFDEIEHPDRETVRAKLRSPVPVAAVACR